MFNFKRNQIIITVLVFMIGIAAYLNTKDLPAGNKPNIAVNDQETLSNIAEETDFFDQYETIETLPPDEDVALNEENGIDDMNGAVDVTSNDALAVDKNNMLEEEQVGITKNSTNTPTESIQAVITKKKAYLDTSSTDGESVAVDKNMDVSYFVEEKMLREQSRASQIDQLTQYVANENIGKEEKAKAAENLLVIQERIEKENSSEALLRAKGFKEVYVRMDDNAVDVVINKAELSDEEIAQIEEIVHRKTGYSVGKIRITPLKGSLQTENN